MTLKALKLRIYPNATQTVQLNKTFGCTRLIYNLMLAEHIHAYEELKNDKEALFQYKYKTEKQFKEEYDFLKEADSIALQQARMNLGVAYANFYKRAKDPKVPKDKKGFPKFKKRHGKNSYRTLMVGNNLKVDFDRRKIKAPKLGWVSFRDNRRVENMKIHNMTFSRTPSMKYYVSILYEDNTPVNHKVDLSRSDLRIKGLDMSLTNFFVDENGESPQYDRNYRIYQERLAALDNKISSEHRGSRRRKLYMRRARIHEHIANKRRDFIEKLSKKLVDENDVIVVETLSLKDMARFRTWSEREMSRDKSNHGKSVNDLGWNCFVTRLKAKAQEQGKEIIEADRWFASSKTCNVCGYVNHDLSIENRVWTCPECGTEHDRDMNAARNLRDVAIRILTGGTPGSAAETRNRSHLQ